MGTAGAWDIYISWRLQVLRMPGPVYLSIKSGMQRCLKYAGLNLGQQQLRTCVGCVHFDIVVRVVCRAQKVGLDCMQKSGTT